MKTLSLLNFQGMFSVFTLVAVLWLVLSISAFAQVDVEMKVKEQKLFNGYSYTFNFKNVGQESVNSFEVTYSGSEPLGHSNIDNWDYSVEEGKDKDGNVLIRKIKWRSEAFNWISPTRSGGFQFTVSEKLSAVNWLAQNKGTGSLASDSVFFDDTPPLPDFTASVALKQGINMISLPLNPKQPLTASSLAAELGSTIVIRVENGTFDAYVHGVTKDPEKDFPIAMGKGYIVNLLAEKTFEVTGTPWGVPAAPPASTSPEPWAFVVAGRVDAFPDFRSLLDLGSLHLRVTNRRTGESRIVPISPSGEFAAAFVDVSRRPVVAAGDEIMTQRVGTDGVSLTGTSKLHVLQPDLARAYLLISPSIMPKQTRLLQNYPNPFNPETWIPFQLATPAEVMLTLYDTRGHLIRILDLGWRDEGFYVEQSKAAYWDGRNARGEAVASGVYFYQFKAGDFTATRRMVIIK